MLLPRETMTLLLPRMTPLTMLPLLRHSSLQTLPLLLPRLRYVFQLALSGMMKCAGFAISNVPVVCHLQNSAGYIGAYFVVIRVGTNLYPVVFHCSDVQYSHHT